MIFEILLLLAVILIPLCWGFDDGYMMRVGTEHHKIKWVIYACLGWIAFCPVTLLSLVGWFMIFKPLFDIGWSIGAGYKKIVIGTTSWADRFIRWLGLVRLEEKVFPAVTALYFFLIVCGSAVVVMFY